MLPSALATLAHLACAKTTPQLLDLTAHTSPPLLTKRTYFMAEFKELRRDGLIGLHLQGSFVYVIAK